MKVCQRYYSVFRVGIGGMNHYPQALLGPILYEMICGVDLKTAQIW